MSVGGWLYRWRHVLLYVAICAVFVFTVRQVSDLRDADAQAARDAARAERTSAIRLCESGNERTAVLRDFLFAATAEPDPKQFDFIADPQLRAGVIDQALRGRAEMRARVADVFTERDCVRDLPQPPDETPGN